MAHWSEWSLLLPENPFSNPTSEIFIEKHLFTVDIIEKTQIDKNIPGVDVIKLFLEEIWKF